MEAWRQVVTHSKLLGSIKVSGELQSPAALIYSGHWIGDCVDHKAGLDISENRNISLFT